MGVAGYCAVAAAGADRHLAWARPAPAGAVAVMAGGRPADVAVAADRRVVGGVRLARRAGRGRTGRYRLAGAGAVDRLRHRLRRAAGFARARPPRRPAAPARRQSARHLPAGAVRGAVAQPRASPEARHADRRRNRASRPEPVPLHGVHGLEPAPGKLARGGAAPAAAGHVALVLAQCGMARFRPVRAVAGGGGCGGRRPWRWLWRCWCRCWRC